MKGKGELHQGKLPHMLLSVASMEATSANVLAERMDARYGLQDATPANMGAALRLLVARGYLSATGKGGRGSPYQYTLTPAGEAELDRLWDLEHGRSAA